MENEELNESFDGASLPRESDCIFLDVQSKPRLRWTPQLHDRFVNAVMQLGGPEKSTPKSIMRVMGVEGLTLYHLKSHLQKYRLARQGSKEVILAPKDVGDLPPMKTVQIKQQLTTEPSTEELDDGCLKAMRAQMEHQKRLHEQMEVERYIQVGIQAQERYLKAIIGKAFNVLISGSINPSYDALTDGTSSMMETCNNELFNVPRVAFAGEASLELINDKAQMAECSSESCLTSVGNQGTLMLKQFQLACGNSEYQTYDGTGGHGITRMSSI